MEIRFFVLGDVLLWLTWEGEVGIWFELSYEGFKVSYVITRQNSHPTVLFDKAALITIKFSW